MRLRTERLETPAGLAAFEDAPCFREAVEGPDRTAH
jgi:hypothetical protein